MKYKFPFKVAVKGQKAALVKHYWKDNKVARRSEDEMSPKERKEMSDRMTFLIMLTIAAFVGLTVKLTLFFNII